MSFYSGDDFKNYLQEQLKAGGELKSPLTGQPAIKTENGQYVFYDGGGGDGKDIRNWAFVPNKTSTIAGTPGDEVSQGTPDTVGYDIQFGGGDAYDQSTIRQVGQQMMGGTGITHTKTGGLMQNSLGDALETGGKYLAIGVAGALGAYAGAVAAGWITAAEAAELAAAGVTAEAATGMTAGELAALNTSVPALTSGMATVAPAAAPIAGTSLANATALTAPNVVGSTGVAAAAGGIGAADAALGGSGEAVGAWGSGQTAAELGLPTGTAAINAPAVASTGLSLKDLANPALLTAGANVVGDLVGAKVQSDASKDAAAAQQQSAAAQLALQEEMYNQSRDDFAPYQKLGTDAAPKLANYDQFAGVGEIPNYDQIVTNELPNYNEDPATVAQKALGQQELQRRLSARGLNYGTTGASAGAELNQKYDLSGYDKYKTQLADRYGAMNKEYGLRRDKANTGYQQLLDQVKIGQGAASSAGTANTNMASGGGKAIGDYGTAGASNSITQGNNTATLINNLGQVPANVLNLQSLYNKNNPDTSWFRS